MNPTPALKIVEEPKPLNEQSTSDLLARGYALKAAIDAQKDELANINLELQNRTTFPADKATGHLEAEGYKAKITKKENIKYDQERLLKIKELMPSMFEQSFKVKYESDSAAIKVFMGSDKEFASAIIWSRIITPGSPSVTIEKVEG